MLQVGDNARIEWDFGEQLAQDLLRAITILADKSIKRVDSDGFKAYWAGSVLRIDIEEGTVIG